MWIHILKQKWKQRQILNQHWTVINNFKSNFVPQVSIDDYRQSQNWELTKYPCKYFVSTLKHPFPHETEEIRSFLEEISRSEGLLWMLPRMCFQKHLTRNWTGHGFLDACLPSLAQKREQFWCACSLDSQKTNYPLSPLHPSWEGWTSEHQTCLLKSQQWWEVGNIFNKKISSFGGAQASACFGILWQPPQEFRFGTSYTMEGMEVTRPPPTRPTEMVPGQPNRIWHLLVALTLHTCIVDCRTTTQEIAVSLVI